MLIVPPNPAQSRRQSEGRPRLTRRTLRRLAESGGETSLRRDTGDLAAQFLDDFLSDVIYDVVQYCMQAKRRTISPEDVSNALRRRGLRVF